MCCLFFGLALGPSGAALADPAEEPEIVVTALRSLLGVQPERSLDSADVEAYGLGTVGEVIAEVAAENGETGEDPAYLINGTRIQGLGSVTDLPAEAIVGIDVLPAGSGVKVGATPRQRVYNIRLRRELDLATLGAAARVPTEGAWSSQRGDISFTHIRQERRITLAAKYRDESMLLESERGVIQPSDLPPEAGRLRSLSAASNRVDLSFAASDALTSWLSGTLVSKLSLAHRHALLGSSAPTTFIGKPLDQSGKTLAGSADLTLNGQVGSWQVSLFGNYAYRRARTSTDRVVPDVQGPLVSATRSITRSLGTQLNVFGPVIDLPAGPLVLNLGAGASRDIFDGVRDFQGIADPRSTTFTSTDLSAGIEIPIASKASGILTGIGDLSMSADVKRQHTSDFGSFQNYNLSMLWRPSGSLSLTGTISRSESTPPVASIEEPTLETPGVRYFDPLRNETLDVTQITGGTPSLRRQRDETRRFAANLQPFKSLGLRLNTEYFEARNFNLLSELPAASLSLLQAFPERFVRDGAGRLRTVDARAISFARRAERQLRTGLVLTLPLGKAVQGRTGLAEDEDDQGETPTKPMRSRVRPRLQISAAHTWLLASTLNILAGQPAIDLLSPSAVGFGGTGQPRHSFAASVGYAERGLGLRASVQSRGASFVEASGSTPNVLRFNPLTTFSLRGWVQGERLAPRSTWMKRTRLSLSLVNGSNARERVVDRSGLTPLSYQPAYRDPIGRSIEIELRTKF